MVANSTDAVMVTTAITLVIWAAAILLPLIGLALPRFGWGRLSPREARRPTGTARTGPGLRRAKHRQSKNPNREFVAHLSPAFFGNIRSE